jgi:Thiamine pyrophosphate enzyme, C-terminal TPP binding domain
MVANATGCSSIYGGNLPTTPWTTNADGHGPAWANSLFEDNAEFGLGFRLAADQHLALARARLRELRDQVGPDLADPILSAVQRTESDYAAQRRLVGQLRSRLSSLSGPLVDDLLSVIDHLVRRSVWIVGGDGWAYDIGSGGLDHVLASGRDVNVLVLDTEVYSNTGGQASKATPIGAVAKFAAAGKRVPKKDLALQAIAYRYYLPGDAAFPARDVERRYVEVLTTVKAVVDIPVAVKTGPYFSSFGEMAVLLDRVGADGLVLFNRFMQTDIDPESFTVSNGFRLSQPSEGALPRSWISRLRGRVTCSLAGSTGVERSSDIAAYLLAGADAVMSTSALLRHGPDYAAELLSGLSYWGERKGFASVTEFRAMMSAVSGHPVAGRDGYLTAIEQASHAYARLCPSVRVTSAWEALPCSES